MAVKDPLDPFSEVVDQRRRWNPEWYSWLTENIEELRAAGGSSNIADQTFLGNNSGSTGPATALDMITAAGMLRADTNEGAALRESWQPATGRIFFLEDFGVVADASGGTGTNNLTAIQDAIDAGGAGDVFVLPAGFTGWTGTVELQSHQMLVGRGSYGQSSVVKLSDMGNTAFFIKVGAINSGVENLFMYSAPGATGGVAVGRGTTANDGPENTRIRHVKVTRFDNTGYWYGGVNLDGINNGAANYGSRDVLLEDVLVHGPEGYGIRLAGTNNARLIGCDMVAPDFLVGNPGTLPGGTLSGDIWLTGSASYQNSDTTIFNSTCDDMNIEVTGDCTIVCGPIGAVFIASTVTGLTIVCTSVDSVTDSGATNVQIYQGPTTRYAINAIGGISTNALDMTGNISMSSTAPVIAISAGSGNGSNGIFFREVGSNRWQIRPRYDVVGPVPNEADKIFFIDGDESNGVYMRQNIDGWINLSDARIKDNPTAVSVLERMIAAPKVDYLFRYRHKLSRQINLGPVAQVLARVFPELVVKGDNGTDDVGPDVKFMDNRLWGVNQDLAGVCALQGVKELLDRITKLEERVDFLQSLLVV